MPLNSDLHVTLLSAAWGCPISQVLGWRVSDVPSRSPSSNLSVASGFICVTSNGSHLPLVMKAGALLNNEYGAQGLDHTSTLDTFTNFGALYAFLEQPVQEPVKTSMLALTLNINSLSISL
ncbi:hypothetical protein DM02DRAFT_663838 [Periconia macrospinosa]|uniref:Uncharacterized protein n=1 Tax=Periconia macrospinosa TaxID=97972 RepID=A0A2V1D0K9_9PLEO|nr:hypothetical protein DM02DRAFT_663838 [Periconia macrospinosa]